MTLAYVFPDGYSLFRPRCRSRSADSRCRKSSALAFPRISGVDLPLAEHCNCEEAAIVGFAGVRFSRASMSLHRDSTPLGVGAARPLLGMTLTPSERSSLRYREAVGTLRGTSQISPWQSQEAPPREPQRSCVSAPVSRTLAVEEVSSLLHSTVESGSAQNRAK
jgi:hypothetical protein